jgi:hypothetical protein
MGVRRAIKLKSRKSTLFPSSKCGWRVIGSSRIYFRSGWEAKVAMWLQHRQECLQIAKWEYEPQTFWFLEIKRGCRSYKPDFKVTELDGSHYWIEVKGFMDAKSKTKIKRFNKYYPKEKLIILDSSWFTKNLHFLPKENIYE